MTLFANSFFSRRIIAAMPGSRTSRRHGNPRFKPVAIGLMLPDLTERYVAVADKVIRGNQE
jgi:hypothetical protein